MGGACATGGLTTGYILGGMAGAMLSNLTRTGVYAANGSAVGAGLGALWGSALFLRGDDGAVGSMVKSSAAGTLGGTLGLFAGANLGPALASVTGNSAYALNGALATALSGALTGMALSRVGKDDTFSESLKQAASASLGSTGGWMLGGAIESGIRSLTAASPATYAWGPTLGAVSGGLIGLALCLNRNHMNFNQEN